jgi:hypothetical protein
VCNRIDNVQALRFSSQPEDAPFTPAPNKKMGCARIPFGIAAPCHCEEPLGDAAFRSTVRAVAHCRVAKRLLAMTARPRSIFIQGASAARSVGRQELSSLPIPEHNDTQTHPGT